MYSKQNNTFDKHRFGAVAAAVALALVQAPGLQAAEATRDLDRMMIIGGAEQVDDVPGSAHYIDEANLDQHEYSDINRVLQQVPGVYLQEEDGYGLRPNIGMRGTGVSRSSRITLMEDGVLAAPAPYAAPAAYYFPSVGRMSGVEVRKGSSAIKYGPNTTGGALNLISSQIPTDFAGHLEVGTGDDATRRIHARVGDAGENGGYMVETFQHLTDGFKELDGGGDTGFDVTDVVGKFRINTAPTAMVYQELELKLGNYDQLSNETYLGLTDDDFAATPFRRYAGSQRDQMDVEQQQTSLRHYAELGARADVTTTVYRQDVTRNWYKLDRVNGTGISAILADPTTYAAELATIQGATSADDALSVKANNREYQSQGIQTVVGLSLGQGDIRHEIELGLRYHEDEEDRFQWSDGYRMDNGTMVQTSAGVPGTGSGNNRIASAKAWAAFVQDTIRAGDWVLQPGLRYETIDTRRIDYGAADPSRTGTPTVVEGSESVLMPGIGVTRRINPQLSLVAGVHRGFTPPAPGNADAEAEDSLNYEFGLRYAQGALSSELIGFYNDYDNLLGTCTAATGGGCTIGDQFNGGEVEVKGLEASLAYDIGAARGLGYGVPVRVGYTWTDAQFKTSFDSGFGEWGDVQAGDELPYLPEHQLFAAVGLQQADWRVDLSARYTDDMRTVAGSGAIPDAERVESHVVMDLAGDYRISKDGRLFLAVENLADETYMAARRPAGVRAGKPRSVMAGLKLDF